MNTWAPVFSKIVDSSIWREPDCVVKIFITMLAKKDSDHVVRATAFMIGEWAKKTEKETLDALKVLSSPDTKRIEKQPFDGRRVEKVEDGWLILNGQTYEDLMRDVNRRNYKADWARNSRRKKREWPKNTPLPGQSLNDKSVDRGDGEVHLHDLPENRVDGE